MTRCGKIFGMAVVTVTLVAAAIFAGNVGQGNGKEDVVYASGAMTCDVATPTDPVLSPEPKKPPDFLRSSRKSRRKRQHIDLTSLGSISELM